MPRHRPLLVLLLALVLLAPAAAAAKPAKLRSGAITLSFDNAFGLSLVKLGITPYVIAPALQDSVTFTLPVSGGRTGARKATVLTQGGFDLQDTADHVSLRLTELTAVIRGKHVSLRGLAALDGRELDAFEFATGRARSVVRSAAGITAAGVTLSLTQVGATALNSQFGTGGYTTGAVVGSGQISAGTTAR